MKPLILTADEVRGALAGTLTEIRRPVKFPDAASRVAPYHFARQCDDGGWCFADALLEGILWEKLRALPGKVSPFGVPGALLWCRETWAELLAVSPFTGEPLPITAGEQLIKPPTQWTDSKNATHWNYDGKVIAYAANSDVEFCDGDGFVGPDANRRDMPRWRSPATMPLRFSRLTLVTRAVRVEQVADVWTWIGVPEVLRRDGQPIPPREVQS